MNVEKFSIEFAINCTSNNLKIHCEKSQNNTKNKFEILNPPTILEFELMGKQPSDTIVDSTGAIIDDACFSIENIWIDGILLETMNLQEIMCFIPHYDVSQIEYAKNNNIILPQSVSNQLTLFNNGILKFNLINFYQIYNKNLLNIIYNYNHWVVNSHMGYVSPESLNELREIYKILCNINEC